MEIDEIVKELSEMGQEGDTESNHTRADELLLLALVQISPEGQRVADAWDLAANRVGFWYA